MADINEAFGPVNLHTCEKFSKLFDGVVTTNRSRRVKFPIVGYNIADAYANLDRYLQTHPELGSYTIDKIVLVSNTKVILTQSKVGVGDII
jgi:hypothetical protein